MGAVFDSPTTITKRGKGSNRGRKKAGNAQGFDLNTSNASSPGSNFSMSGLMQIPGPSSGPSYDLDKFHEQRKYFLAIFV